MTTAHPQKTPLDFAAIRTRLSENRGPQYWRSLEELANTDEFQELLQREFPRHASWLDTVSRREFLQFMGASLALGGLSACTRQPDETIVPYSKPPDNVVPGRPLHFATAVLLNGVATGVLVESHTGRPTKIEGNPQHPGSLGSTDAFTQAVVLDLYDPDRSQVVSHTGRISSWDAFSSALQPQLDLQKAKQGAGLRILSETVTSPTLAHQIDSLLQDYPQARWHQYEATGRDAARAGARLAFGEDVDPVYRVDQANVILSLDADLLFSMPGSVRYARDFAAKRKVEDSHANTMNRLYAVESAPTLTGGMADHRLSLRAGDVELFARAIASELGIVNVQAGKWAGAETYAKWITALVRDLQGNQGTSLVVAGEYQPPVVHALAHAINASLGNVGKTVVYTTPLQSSPSDSMASLRELVADIEAGKVEVLVILGGNPAYTAPADIRFVEQLEKVALRIHCSSRSDETSAHCHWHIPEAHTLESWSDARGYDGTVSIIQPLIAPLYSGKSLHEVVAALLGQPSASGYDIVRNYWKTQKTDGDFEQFWRHSLHDGIVAKSAFPAKDVAIKTPEWPAPGDAAGESIDILFRPDPTIWDGRFSNNGWLQELPKPLSKLTWDNAAIIGPATASRLQLSDHQVVTLTYRERTIEAPVLVRPGFPDNTVTIHLGYGRTAAGKVGSGIGFNANALRTSDAPWAGSEVEIRKANKTYQLVYTQDHYSMEGRNLIRAGTIGEFNANSHFIKEMGEDPAPEMTLYPPVKYDGRAWGMTIDLSSCIGCNACTIACQAENNIPVVGKKQVGIGREMHWIRVDRYYTGEIDNPDTVHQPVPCMQCENAPCEPVCPVGATVHSSEGLNDMVYNRCVGTRYCSNNCPYKVRRFNFFLYQDWDTASIKMQRNPNVSIRSRGVMEKCTYCVQRINAARITAEKEDRAVKDGEVVTACQAVCPADAIVFGDINDPNSRVAKAKASPLNYGLLTDLNTRPRTTYLARLKNPNPEIENV